MLVHEHIFDKDEEIPLPYSGKIPPQNVERFSTVVNLQPHSNIQKAFILNTKQLPDKRWRVEYYCAPPLELDWQNHVYLSEFNYEDFNNKNSNYQYSTKLYGQSSTIRGAELRKATTVHTRCCACGHEFIKGEEILKLDISRNKGFNFKTNKTGWPINAVNISIHRDPHKQCKAGVGIINKFKDAHFAELNRARR